MSIAGGRHPFGEAYERDANILRGAPNLSALAHMPEALNLVASMLQREPGEHWHERHSCAYGET